MVTGATGLAEGTLCGKKCCPTAGRRGADDIMPKILTNGLSRNEVHTLEILLQLSFQVIPCEFDTIIQNYSSLLCVVINPKKISLDQWMCLIDKNYDQNMPMLAHNVASVRMVSSQLHSTQRFHCGLSVCPQGGALDFTIRH